MIVNQRLIEFINEVGVQDILKRTTLGQSLIYKLKETGGATSSTLEEIFKGYPNLSAEWLFKGIGNKWNLENYGIVKEDKIDYKAKPDTASVLISQAEVIDKTIELLKTEIKSLQIKVELLEKEIRLLKKK